MKQRLVVRRGFRLAPVRAELYPGLAGPSHRAGQQCWYDEADISTGWNALLCGSSDRDPSVARTY